MGPNDDKCSHGVITIRGHGNECGFCRAEKAEARIAEALVYCEQAELNKLAAILRGESATASVSDSQEPK